MQHHNTTRLAEGHRQFFSSLPSPLHRVLYCLDGRVVPPEILNHKSIQCFDFVFFIFLLQISIRAQRPRQLVESSETTARAPRSTEAATGLGLEVDMTISLFQRETVG